MEQLAKVKFGVKSGKDQFFYVHDITNEEIARLGPERFTQTWSISPADTTAVRVIRAGDGSAHLIEARFLEPELHRLTDVGRPVVTRNDTTRLAVVVSGSIDELSGTHVARYIRYGERQNYHTGSTIAARARSRPWYDLAPLPRGRRGQMFWSKAHQYRHIVPWNADDLICNNNLYDVWAIHEHTAKTLWAILNSTVVAQSKLLYGRPVGREAGLKTEIVDLLMMPIPDPRHASAAITERLHQIITAMAARPSKPLHEELSQYERQELDDAVLALLGVTNPDERRDYRDRLYDEVRRQYIEARELEVQATQNRLRAARRGRVTPASIADELWSSIDAASLRRFPDDFVPSGIECTSFTLPAGVVEVGTRHALIPEPGLLVAGTIRVGGRNGVVLPVPSVHHGEYLRILAEHGINGDVELPEAVILCQNAVSAYRQYHAQLAQRFADMAATRSSDKQRQQQIVRVLLHRAMHRDAI
jgi:hypothetical protein